MAIDWGEAFHDYYTLRCAEMAGENAARSALRIAQMEASRQRVDHAIAPKSERGTQPYRLPPAREVEVAARIHFDWDLDRMKVAGQTDLVREPANEYEEVAAEILEQYPQLPRYLMSAPREKLFELLNDAIDERDQAMAERDRLEEESRAADASLAQAYEQAADTVAQLDRTENMLKPQQMYLKTLVKRYHKGGYAEPKTTEEAVARSEAFRRLHETSRDRIAEYRAARRDGAGWWVAYVGSQHAVPRAGSPEAPWREQRAAVILTIAATMTAVYDLPDALPAEAGGNDADIVLITRAAARDLMNTDLHEFADVETEIVHENIRLLRSEQGWS